MKMKENDKDRLCENYSKKNDHLRAHNKEKRKSESKKRKKMRTENNVLNYEQPDILMDNLHSKDYDQICSNYGKYQRKDEEKTKSKSKKRKKDLEENVEVGKRKRYGSENLTERSQIYEKRENFDNNMLIYNKPDVLKKRKKTKKMNRSKLDLQDHDKISNEYEDRKYEKYKKKKCEEYAENSNREINIVNKNHEEGKNEMNEKYLPRYPQTKVFKEKKKKKKSKKDKSNKDDSNIEISKASENNEDEEDYIQNRKMVSTEQPESDEKSTRDESYIESIRSLYSHEYTNDPSRLNSRSEDSKTGKKKKKKTCTIEMYEDFIYKPPTNEKQFDEIENFLDKDSFWKKHEIKYKGNSFSDEEIEKDLLERVEYIADYFDRFDEDDLTEEECQEKEILDFRGPYLPTPQHIRFLGSLDIELDFEMSEEQQFLLSIHSYRELRESGVPWITGSFDRSEDSILLENWQEFKEKYKFNDLRPLISFRTMKIKHEEGCYNFELVDYISEDERHKFCLYMSRGLEKRNIFQIRQRLMYLAVRIRYYGISYDPMYIEPREAAEIEGFIKLFGTNYKGMEFIIGKLNSSRYRCFSQIYVKYKNMPIRIGQWQSTEKCRLVRSIFRATGASNIQELLHCKISWKEVFLLMQTRFHHQCQKFFNNYLSRFLELATHISNHKTDSDNIYWTASGRVKLIMLVSDNLGPRIGKIDWEEVSSHFEVFGPFSCAHQFRVIYNKFVPSNKKNINSMEEAVDYLIEFVVPKIENGEITFKEEVLDLDEICSLPLKKDQELSSDKWSLSNTIKLIKEVYENAGSSVETTNWDEISSYFIEYDEADCRNHFRYLYYNRVPHQHRKSLDTALDYLKNRICPMLENKKQRNRKELLLTEEVVQLSPEDHLILRALLNDINNADDDEDIAMLQEENNDSSNDHALQSTPNDSHVISETARIAKLNALSNYIQEKQDEEDIDGNLEDISTSDKLGKYIDDFEKEGNDNLNLHLSTDDELGDNSVE